jgi:predicted peptidase
VKNHFLLLLLNFSIAFGQVYEAKFFENQEDTLPYRILLPKDYNPQNAYPLLIVLHGAGERGNDNEAQLVHGSYLFQTEQFRAKYPAIVVFPQCPKDSYWANVERDYNVSLEKKYNYAKSLPKNHQLEMVEALMTFLETNYRIDPNRRYLGGLSMGGMGTFELVSRNPDYFAAAFPICGGANPNWASLLQKTPLWIFHGEQDDVVWAEHSKRMFRALKELDAPVKLTLYPEVKHDSWHNAFADPDLFQWLFSFQKK